ncbi:MAG: sigma-E factor regulatory protein RseB domain-containing protein [Armatimonadota bacterium]|nr:sigma-E factor regulatory protein RseB domain-containing protein [Armatimonadota bacterium]MDR5703718.1 sigma-E factor regulatory protein RseB domain-containing protein [Armatimonadota bacterium]
MIRVLVTGILLVMLALPQAARAAPSPLVRAVRAQAEVAYQGEQIVMTWLGSTVDVALVKIQHDPASQTRLAYTPLGSSRRLNVLFQDETEIRYDPTRQRGTRTARVAFGDQLDEVFLATHLPLLQANYRISVSPGRFLGRNVEIVVLSPISRDRPTRRMAIDQETGVILRSERIRQDGRLVQATVFLSFQVMPRGWLKEMRPPANIDLREIPPPRWVTLEEAAKRLGDKPVPIVPPEGFKPIAYYLTSGREPVLQEVYTDGLSVLLVTYRRGTLPHPPRGSHIVRGKTGPIWALPMGLRNLVHWSYRGWLITMVGEVTMESLVRSAERTGVAPSPRVWDRILSWFRDLRGFLRSHLEESGQAYMILTAWRFASPSQPRPHSTYPRTLSENPQN